MSFVITDATAQQLAALATNLNALLEDGRQKVAGFRIAKGKLDRGLEQAVLGMAPDEVSHIISEPEHLYANGVLPAATFARMLQRALALLPNEEALPQIVAALQQIADRKSQPMSGYQNDACTELSQALSTFRQCVTEHRAAFSDEEWASLQQNLHALPSQVKRIDDLFSEAERLAGIISCKGQKRG